MLKITVRKHYQFLADNLCIILKPMNSFSCSVADQFLLVSVAQQAEFFTVRLNLIPSTIFKIAKSLHGMCKKIAFNFGCCLKDQNKGLIEIHSLTQSEQSDRHDTMLIWANT